MRIRITIIKKHSQEMKTGKEEGRKLGTLRREGRKDGGSSPVHVQRNLKDTFSHAHDTHLYGSSHHGRARQAIRRALINDTDTEFDSGGGGDDMTSRVLCGVAVQ